MHGKKREEYKAKTRDPKTAAILAKKAEQWYILMKELQVRRRQEQASSKDHQITLQLLGKALEVNPDPSNLWNHRREIVLCELQPGEELSSSGDANEPNLPGEAQTTETATAATTTTEATTETTTATSEANATTILQRERILTQKALERNPKAYGAWFHRKWILQRLRPPLRVLREELALTKQFLRVDERNFHCWNYRRFVVACLGGSWDGEWTVASSRSANQSPAATSPPPGNTSLMGTQVVMATNRGTTGSDEGITNPVVIPTELLRSELDFTSEKIKENFSNFSAFHYRSQLLDLCRNSDDGNDDDDDACDLEAILEEEFQLIEDAVCTEPDDQTCWWYHAILLDKLLPVDSHNNKNDDDDDDESSLLSALRPRLQEQAELFREILEDSPDSKWVILGLFRVVKLLGGEGHNDDEEEEDADDGNGSIESAAEQQRLLDRLVEIDPYRSKRYEELRAT